MKNVLSIDSAHIEAPNYRGKPLTHRFDPAPAPVYQAPLKRHIEFEIYIPIATGGKQTWHYSANGHPIGKIVRDRNPNPNYCVMPLHSGVKKVFRFSTFSKADEFLKDSCK